MWLPVFSGTFSAACSNSFQMNIQSRFMSPSLVLFKSLPKFLVGARSPAMIVAITLYVSASWPHTFPFRFSSCLAARVPPPFLTFAFSFIYGSKSLHRNKNIQNPKRDFISPVYFSNFKSPLQWPHHRSAAMTSPLHRCSSIIHAEGETRRHAGGSAHPCVDLTAAPPFWDSSMPGIEEKGRPCASSSLQPNYI